MKFCKHSRWIAVKHVRLLSHETIFCIIYVIVNNKRVAVKCWQCHLQHYIRTDSCLVLSAAERWMHLPHFRRLAQRLNSGWLERCMHLPHFRRLVHPCLGAIIECSMHILHYRQDWDLNVGYRTLVASPSIMSYTLTLQSDDCHSREKKME